MKTLLILLWLVLLVISPPLAIALLIVGLVGIMVLS
jgi:hypothetical protein